MKQETRQIVLDVSEAVHERDNRIRQLEDDLAKARCVLDLGQPPMRDMVTFVGGPYHGQSRILQDTEKRSGLVTVPVLASYYPVVDSYGYGSGVVTGTYQVLPPYHVRFSAYPYLVAMWQGANR
jgi:hypothetical protein